MEVESILEKLRVVLTDEITRAEVRGRQEAQSEFNKNVEPVAKQVQKILEMEIHTVEWFREACVLMEKLRQFKI